MTPRARRSTLLDIMALVAATAMGAALVRSWYDYLVAESEGRRDWWFFGKAASWFLLPFSPICLVLDRARRRPPGAEGLCAPGLWANAAVVLAVLIRIGELVLDRWLRPLPDWEESWREWLPYPVWEEVWRIVLAAWCGLALSGRWRAEATWIDRMGRALGVFWLGVYAVSRIQTYQMYH